MRLPPLLAAAGVLLFFVALSCAAVSPQSPSPDRGFELRVGATARIEGSDLAVRFDDVPKDSRCPVDVVCITAGDATVTLFVTGGGAADATHEVHAIDAPREARHGAWNVALVRLEPRPVSTRKTPRGDYVVTLRVSRAG